jgi:hypothetical protein
MGMQKKTHLSLEMSFSEHDFRKCDNRGHGDHQSMTTEFRNNITAGQLPQVVNLLKIEKKSFITHKTDL